MLYLSDARVFRRFHMFELMTRKSFGIKLYMQVLGMREHGFGMIIGEED